MPTGLGYRRASKSFVVFNFLISKNIANLCVNLLRIHFTMLHTFCFTLHLTPSWNSSERSQIWRNKSKSDTCWGQCKGSKYNARKGRKFLGRQSQFWSRALRDTDWATGNRRWVSVWSNRTVCNLLNSFHTSHFSLSLFSRSFSILLTRLCVLQTLPRKPMPERTHTTLERIVC